MTERHKKTKKRIIMQKEEAKTTHTKIYEKKVVTLSISLVNNFFIQFEAQICKKSQELQFNYKKMYQNWHINK